MTNAAVIGAGAWGLALADYLARLGLAVSVWDRSPEVLHSLRTSRTINRPAGLVVNETVSYYDSLIDTVQDADVILNVVPSFAAYDICSVLKTVSWPGKGAIYVNCSKGIEPETLKLPCEIFSDVVGSRPDLRYSVLAGPSHAEEVSRNVPTAVVAASDNPQDAIWLQTKFNSSTFRVYTHDDVKGVELGGALKNVIAIGVGICDGKGFGDNSKAALITRGLAETARLASAIGANPNTVSGLSGLGDLIVTAMSKHSRNRGFGDLIGSGHTPQSALDKIGAVVEGYKTSKSTHDLAVKLRVEMPIVSAIYRVLYDGLNIEDGVSLLLDRCSKIED